MSERTWMVLARIEGDDSLFADDPITEKELRDMAGSYDPEFRKAPIITGYDPDGGASGPSHWVGEFNAPLGFATALAFDGLNLWGEVEQRYDEDGVGLVEKAVAKGFLQRSIGWWRKLVEVKNKPYLRHIALLGGEPPGIPNLPPLDQYFRSMVGEQLGRVVENAPYCVRNMFNAPRPAASPASRGGNTEEKAMEIDEKQLEQIVARTVASTLKAEREANPPVDVAKASEEAVARAMAPLNEKIEKMTEELEKERERTAASLLETRTAEIGRRLDALVESGRVTPAEAKEERSFYEGLAHEKVQARLDTLERRAPNARLSQQYRGIEVGSGDDAATVEIDRRNYSLPEGETLVDPTSLRAVAEARHLAGEDATKFRSTLLKVAGSGGH